MMEDIYGNLDNYNEQAIIEELQNENKELKLQLEQLNSRLGTLQTDFDKLFSEHKKLESNYSSLLKTAKAEVERKTQTIALLNTEKDKLILQTLQNRNNRRFPKNNASGNTIIDDRRKNNYNKSDKQCMEAERRDSRISPKENSTDNSAKEDISQKRPNIDEKPSSRIKDRRKSMPVYDIPAKFSSDEEHIPSVKENFVPREYPDRHIDRHCRSGFRTSECSSLEERTTHNYETKGPKGRHYRNVEIDKSRNYDRSEFSQRYKRESPGRNRKRNRDAYEDKKSDYDRHWRFESPPNDKYSNYSLRQHPNYEKQRYQDNDRYSGRCHDRHATKHRAPEYDEHKTKKMKPNTYPRQYEDNKWNHEKHQIADEYDRNMKSISCQSPDINFMESNDDYPITEIKLNATMKLDDPRMFSNRYVKDTKGKDTLTAVRGMNVPPLKLIPLENTDYEMEYVKIPEALKEKPASDDLLTQIYNDVDNPLLNASVESGEIPCDPQDKIHLEPHLPNDEKGQSSNKNSSATDKPPQQKLSTYKIPKIKPCTSGIQSSKHGEAIVHQVKHNDSKSSDNTTEVKSNNSKSKRKPAFNKDLKKDNITELKEKIVLDKPPQLPTLNTDIESKDEHEKKKQFQKIVEDDLELSDETCDDTEIHKIKHTVPIDNKTVSVSQTQSLNLDQESEVPCEVDTTKNKSPGHDKKIKSKKKHSKHKSTQEQTKPAKKSKEKHEVKSEEVIKHKFSELFGDSNSLILPEDLGITSVPPPLSQHTELQIFEDAQDAIDVNVNNELPKLNEIETSKLPVEKGFDTKVPKLDTQTEIVNKEIKTLAEEILPIQSIYQNLEVGIKPKEDTVKTVIISTGVQPNVINDNKPLVEEHSKPININMKALATSTPHKLASRIPDINTKVIETNGNTDHSKEVNAMDTSGSNIETKSNETDVPDVRIVVKRRRRVMKKP